MLCIKNGRIHDAVHREPYPADILIENEKIVQIGENLCAEETIDAAGLDVYPGFVDAHSHIGLDGYGEPGVDYNEMNDICCPQLRAIDGIDPMDESFVYARNAGVTCVCTGPGSANVLGGTFTAIKTAGKRIDDMVVKQAAAMKCAFGENPKRCYKSKCDSSRMTTAAILREALMKARLYMQKKEAAGDDVSKQPAFDMKLEALIPVLRGEIPLKAHAHRADDIFTAIRIANEFGVRLTLEHTTEGHLIADELAKTGLCMAVGPSLGHATKVEVRNKSWKTPDILTRAGCHVSIITDCTVIPQQYLPLCAGMAVKAGMDPFEALKAITIHPAEHIGIADRVGSLEAGKDADVVIVDGSPFEVSTTFRRVLINGKTVFSI